MNTEYQPPPLWQVQWPLSLVFLAMMKFFTNEKSATWDLGMSCFPCNLGLSDVLGVVELASP